MASLIGIGHGRFDFSEFKGMFKQQLLKQIGFAFFVQFVVPAIVFFAILQIPGVIIR